MPHPLHIAGVPPPTNASASASTSTSTPGPHIHTVTLMQSQLNASAVAAVATRRLAAENPRLYLNVVARKPIGLIVRIIVVQKNRTIPVQTSGRLMTVEELRECIRSVEGVPTTKQRLVFRGKVMRDQLSDGRRATLLSFGIGKDHPGECHKECTHTIVMFPETVYAERKDYTQEAQPLVHWTRPNKGEFVSPYLGGSIPLAQGFNASSLCPGAGQRKGEAELLWDKSRTDAASTNIPRDGTRLGLAARTKEGGVRMKLNSLVNRRFLHLKAASAAAAAALQAEEAFMSPKVEAGAGAGAVGVGGGNAAPAMPPSPVHMGRGGKSEDGGVCVEDGGGKEGGTGGRNTVTATVGDEDVSLFARPPTQWPQKASGDPWLQERFGPVSLTTIEGVYEGIGPFENGHDILVLWEDGRWSRTMMCNTGGAKYMHRSAHGTYSVHRLDPKKKKRMMLAPKGGAATGAGAAPVSSLLSGASSSAAPNSNSSTPPMVSSPSSALSSALSSAASSASPPASSPASSPASPSASSSSPIRASTPPMMAVHEVRMFMVEEVRKDVDEDADLEGTDDEEDEDGEGGGGGAAMAVGVTTGRETAAQVGVFIRRARRQRALCEGLSIVRVSG